jgi:hypothetical protein
MPRLSIPVVEVTAPDGTKSFWVAYSVSHREAVAAVKHLLPSTHRAELSGRRLPPGLKFDGARPGDLIKPRLQRQAGRRCELAVDARPATRACARSEGNAAQLVVVVRGLAPESNVERPEGVIIADRDARAARTGSLQADQTNPPRISPVPRGNQLN